MKMLNTKIVYYIHIQPTIIVEYQIYCHKWNIKKCPSRKRRFDLNVEIDGSPGVLVG